MTLKFGKAIRTLRLSKNYLILKNIKSVSDKHTHKSNVVLFPYNMAFNLLAGGCQ